MPESTFDPEAFMEQTVEGEMSTQPQRIPTCETYGVIDNVKVKEIQTKNGPRVVAEVWWLVTDDELKSRLDRDRLAVRQTCWIDFTDDGAFDLSEGRNVDLGRLRAATGQNQPGEPWAIGMLKGAGPCTLKIVEDEKGEYPSEVKNVAPME